MDTQEDNRPLLPQHTKAAAWAMFLLFVYSVAMFSLPFAAFFGTRHSLKEHFEVIGYTNTVWSVVASVITIYLVIFAYAYQGYYEKEFDDEGNEIDPNSYNQWACEPPEDHVKAD